MERYVKTRSIVRMADVIEADYTECIMLCINKFAWDTCRTFLYDYGQRRTSFAMTYNQNSYEVPDDAEFDVIQASISDALGSCTMSCDEIVTALGDINISIQSGGECGGQEGSGGSGTTEGVEEVFEDDGDTTFPPLYDDRAAYVDNKCGIARMIIQDILADLLWIQSANLASLGATFLIGALISPIPGDEILAFAGFLIAIFLEGTIVAVMAAIMTAINDNMEEVICALMNASTSGNAQTDFLIELGLSGVNFYAIDLIVNNDSFNRLFQYGTIQSGFTPCDCDEGLLTCVFMEWGTYLGDNEFQSEFHSAGRHILIFYPNNNSGTSGDTCADVPNMTYDELIGHSNWAGGSDYFLHEWNNGGLNILYASDTQPGDTMTADRIEINSATAFTVTFGF